MQGFFGKPVDNLFAEPLIARWIRINVPSWREAVVVSKNAGGTKRVTSLADALKLNFGIVTTDRRRPKLNWTVTGSTIFFDSVDPALHSRDDVFDIRDEMLLADRPSSSGTPHSHANPALAPSPLANTITSQPLLRPETPPAARRPSEEEAAYEYTDERAREVITGRLVQGHIVDDDYPSPVLSSMSASGSTLPDRHNTDGHDGAVQDPMTSSFVSTVSSYQPDHTPGVSYDDAGSSDDEESGQQSADEEKTITLVGQVKNKTVFIVDDMIDKCGSWIAAAETVVKKGGATKVYCIATHGLFNDESLGKMEQCDCIDHIVITNSFPITQKAKDSKKLVVLDLSTLISEGIRRHHYGERFVYSMMLSHTPIILPVTNLLVCSISALFQLHD
jgi:ribose-phosphate pyrophosphokinase